MCRLITFNCGKDQQLNKVVRGGEPQEHQDTALWGKQYHSFPGWAKNILKFQIEKIEDWHHRRARARSNQRSKEKKTLLVSMTSAQEKRSKAEGKLHYISL